MPLERIPMKYIFTFFFLLLSVSTLQGQCWRTIASKYDQVMAIHEDGTLWRWSTRAVGRPVLFNADTTWQQISAGYNFYAGIKSDGTLWTWGNNDYGQLGNGTTTFSFYPIQVGTDNNWKQVSCGEGHIAAVRMDGTLWLWGRNQYGQMGAGTNRTNRTTPAQMGSATNWIQVAAGEYGTTMKTSLNTLWIVGSCYNTTENSAPHQIGSGTDWKTMSSGSGSYYGIKLNGTLWRWSASAGYATGMTQIGVATGWDKVDVSHSGHTLLIKTNGSLWALGTNSFGCLGDGTLNNASLPVQVGTDTDWKEAVAGNMYSLALKNNLTFWGWGRNQNAQFGNGESKNTLHTVDGGGAWKFISAAEASYNAHLLGIRENGELWGWGPNGDGQLGDSTQVSKAVPVRIGTDTTWKNVSNGFHFSAGVRENGTLWTWGRNGRGQLGLGLSPSAQKSVPTQVGTDTTWKMVAAGSEYVLAIKENGTLWSWGWNSFGQLGNGTSAEAAINIPVQVGTDTTWQFITAGHVHALAIKKDSTLWSWGDGSDGQLARSGNRTIPMQVGTSKWIDASASGEHSAGIKADSTLYLWGNNLYSQSGNSNINAPYSGGAGSKWIDVDCGYDHTVALRKDQTLWGIGRAGQGQLADSVSYAGGMNANSLVKLGGPSSTATWKKASAGTYSTHLISTDGTLYSCGDSYSVEYNMSFPVLGYVFPSPIQLNSCTYCPPSYLTMNQNICLGDSVFFNGTYRLSAGIYKDTLVNAIGCDSIITLNLQVLYPATGTDTRFACNAYTWIDGVTYTSNNTTATYTFPGGAANGCDSIATLNLTIGYPATGTDVQIACDSYTWINGTTYTASNTTAMHTIPEGAVNGCDSIVTLNLTMLHSATGTDVQTACNSFTWIDGVVYTATNHTATYTFPGAAANGCDSIVTLNLTMRYTATGTDVISTCEPYTWIDGNTYATSSTTATYVFPGGAANGCDSIATLNLTVNSPTTGTDVQISCGPYTWIDGVTYVSGNNTATYVLSNAAGCDSVVTLNLTVNSPSAGTDVQTACGSYTWIDGITYLASNSTATHLLTNAAGCDSLVTLNLTINSLAAGTDYQASCGNYTWIDGITYTTSNSTATHLIPGGAVNGCDSIVTLDLTVSLPVTVTDVQSSCGPFTWIDGNTYTTSNTTATHLLSTVAGCDSLVMLQLTVNSIDPAVSVNGLTLTANESGLQYQWIDCGNGNSPIMGATAQSYTAVANGDYAVRLQGSGCIDTSACETISIVGLTENPGPAFSVYPNPNTGIVTLELGFDLPVTITDARGRKIYEGEMPAGKTTLDLSGEANGVYLVNVKGPKGTQVHRIVINR
jgi:alpha-tubulin suppressor-like RCC1 family protein